MSFNHVTGHVVHKFLGTTLTSDEFTLAILLLFIEHTNMLLLGLNVHFLLFLLISSHLCLVHLVLNKHFLKVLALLLTLLRLKIALSLHFIFQAVDKLNFSTEVSFLVVAALALLLIELAVTALLFLLGFDSGEVTLFLLAHTEQLNVLLLQLVVDLLLIFVGLGALSFLTHLLVKLLAHQAATLLFTHHRLLLFLVVEELVEFLDCCPFVFLGNFRVHFSHAVLL